MLHIAWGRKQSYIPLAIINLNEDENIFLKKGEILGQLESCPIEIGEIIKEDWAEIDDTGKEEETIPLGKFFYNFSCRGKYP